MSGNPIHHKFKEYIDEGVDCIMYNLGFLPGGDKSVTTMHETSLQSIKEGLQLLNNGGIMTICIYRGHNEGKKEESCILDYVVSLPKNKFGVMEHSFLNRSEVAPMLRHYNISKAFMGTTGFSPTSGITHSTQLEASVKRCAVNIAQNVYLLADHLKFDAFAPYTYCTLDDIDKLYTDAPLSEDYAKLCQKHHTEVIICNN